MTLIETFDEIEKRITAGAALFEIKPLLVTFRDQLDALERDHSALKSAHSNLQDEHAKLQNSHSELNEKFTEAQKKRQSGYGMGDIGGRRL